MTDLYTQDSLPGFNEAMADLTRKEIGEEATCQHLQRQMNHWARYAKFSKDPEFRRRAQFAQARLHTMIHNAPRSI